VILERDGSWHPVPKEEDCEASTSKKNGASKAGKEDEECIDLSDDDEIPLPSSRPPLPAAPPPLLQPPPPPPPREIECIDLD
jgi:hypothetical protein